MLTMFYACLLHIVGRYPAGCTMTKCLTLVPTTLLVAITRVQATDGVLNISRDP